MTAKNNRVAPDERDEILLSDALKQAYAVPASSDDFGRRLRTLAAAQDAKTQTDATRRDWLRRAGVAAAVAVAGVVCVFALMPTRGASAKGMMARVRAAVANAATAYIHEWRPMHDGPETLRKTWYSNGMRRRQDEFQVWIDKGDRAYNHWLRENRVEIYKREGVPPLLSASELLRQFQVSGIDDRAHPLPDAVVAGRNAHRILLDLPPCPPNSEPAFYSEETPVRAIVAVDPANDLPFRTETQAFHDGEWRPVLYADVLYNEKLPESLFATDFPGAKVLTPEKREAAEREQFYRGMKKGYAQTVGVRTITVRGFDTTELGDAFVFYTVSGADAGKTPEWTTRLNDKTPRHYERIGGGVVGRFLPELTAKWTFDNQRLYVDWFRPNGRGTLDDYGGWKFRVRFPNGAEATFNAPDGRLCSGPIPFKDDPYKEILIENAKALSDAARERAEWFENGGWKSDAALVREAMKGDYDPLKESLVWYELTVKIEEQAAALTGKPAPNLTEEKSKIASIRQRMRTQ